MTVIRRRNAADYSANVGDAGLEGGGGTDSAAAPQRGRRVKQKVRYSRDPAAELMPAAEFLGQAPDFSAILEDFADSPFNPAQRRVLGKLMGVFAMDYQGARSEERSFLRRLLCCRNAREGYAANRALHLCRISNALRRTLAIGVAESRFTKGKPVGFLGSVQARTAATTFLLLGPKGRELIWDLLTAAGGVAISQTLGADPVIERALILKALAARRHRLGPWSLEGETALKEIATFATQIKGTSRGLLALLTTLEGSTKDQRPKAISSQPPTKAATEIARGDLDPIYAWKLNGGVVAHSMLSETVTKEDEVATVMAALDRSPLLDRPRLHQALAQARQRGEALLSPPQCIALSDYLTGSDLSPTRLTYKTEGLAALHKRGFDLISERSLETIRNDARGIYKFDAAQGLGLLLSRITGAVYLRRVFNDQVAAGANPLLQMLYALRNGMAIPLTVNKQKVKHPDAWTLYAQKTLFGEQMLLFELPKEGDLVELRAALLAKTKLPADEFGADARIDAFFAPAALDLFAPPFGLLFPTLGIKDNLL